MSRTVASACQTLGEFLSAMADRLADDGVADPPPTAELIAVHVLGLPRERLGAETGRPPTDEEQARLRSLLGHISAGSPAAYLIYAGPDGAAKGQRRARSRPGCAPEVRYRQSDKAAARGQ